MLSRLSSVERNMLIPSCKTWSRPQCCSWKPLASITKTSKATKRWRLDAAAGKSPGSPYHVDPPVLRLICCDTISRQLTSRSYRRTVSFHSGMHALTCRICSFPTTPPWKSPRSLLALQEHRRADLVVLDTSLLLTDQNILVTA